VITYRHVPYRHPGNAAAEVPEIKEKMVQGWIGLRVAHADPRPRASHVIVTSLLASTGWTAVVFASAIPMPALFR
jgi:hypothetical protein